MGATQPDVRDDPSGGRALESQALEFFARWGGSFDAFAASFELLAEDCVWDQRPIPQLVGPRAAVRFLMLARRTLGVETCDVEIVRVASEGSVVHVERVDRLRRADGSLIVAAPVAGVLTFSGGQLIHWREYFDSAEFVAQALTTGAAHLASRCAAVVRGAYRSTRKGAETQLDA
jgi:limonene-1,2-epoxide hydrolase